jgi:hypothetical protein
VFKLDFNNMSNLINLWDFFHFWWVFLLILSWSYKSFLFQDYFNDKTCSFYRLIFNQVIKSINAFHVLEINCTLMIITNSSDLNLINKWTCLCLLSYDDSWCFRVLRKVANICIIWFNHCNAFIYCWIMFISWFIESSIKLRRKSIKSSYIC